MDSATFNISVKINGSFYGIALLHGSESPSSVQIRNMLNATNFYVANTSYFNVSFVYPGTVNANNPNYTMSAIANFTKLLDNTLYDAYFIAENSYPNYPDLLPDQNIQMVTFLTQSEMYTITSDFDFGTSLGTSVLLILTIVMFLMS